MNAKFCGYRDILTSSLVVWIFQNHRKQHTLPFKPRSQPFAWRSIFVCFAVFNGFSQFFEHGPKGVQKFWLRSWSSFEWNEAIARSPTFRIASLDFLFIFWKQWAKRAAKPTNCAETKHCLYISWLINFWTTHFPFSELTVYVQWIVRKLWNRDKQQCCFELNANLFSSPGRSTLLPELINIFYEIELAIRYEDIRKIRSICKSFTLNFFLLRFCNWVLSFEFEQYPDHCRNITVIRIAEFWTFPMF